MIENMTIYEAKLRYTATPLERPYINHSTLNQSELIRVFSLFITNQCIIPARRRLARTLLLLQYTFRSAIFFKFGFLG